MNTKFKDSLAQRLRLVGLAEESESMTETVQRLLASGIMNDARDFGVRAALADYLGVLSTKSLDLLQDISTIYPMFRNPVIRHGQSYRLEEGDQKLSYAVVEEGDEEFGHAVFSEHLLSWLAMQRSDSLLVRLCGAVDRAKVTLPYYGGKTSWMGREESFMIFSDPNLDRASDLNLGWYLGVDGEGRSIFDRIAEVINVYVEKWSIKNVALIGSSGGGYACLQIGARLSNAEVLVMNPQIVLGNYYQSRIDDAIGAAFKDVAKATSEFGDLFDAREIIGRAKDSKMQLHYVDNAQGDRHHHEQHFRPFAEESAKRGFELNHVIINSGKGHRTPSIAQQNLLIDKLLRTKNS